MRMRIQTTILYTWVPRGFCQYWKNVLQACARLPGEFYVL